MDSNINKITYIVVRLAGLGGFIWQIIQFFTGRWTYEWYIEVLMIFLFFIIARYPKKMLYILETILSKLKPSK